MGIGLVLVGYVKHQLVACHIEFLDTRFYRQNLKYNLQTEDSRLLPAAYHSDR